MWAATQCDTCMEIQMFLLAQYAHMRDWLAWGGSKICGIILKWVLSHDSESVFALHIPLSCTGYQECGFPPAIVVNTWSCSQANGVTWPLPTRSLGKGQTSPLACYPLTDCSPGLYAGLACAYGLMRSLPTTKLIRVWAFQYNSNLEPTCWSLWVHLMASSN